MRFLSTILIIALCFSAFSLEQQQQHKSILDYEQLLLEEQGNHKELFTQFQTQFKKQYASAEEEYKSLQIFKKNLFSVFRHQTQDASGKYSITKFSDLTPQQFEEIYLTPLPEITLSDIPQQPQNQFTSFGILDYFGFGESNDLSIEDLPKSHDWREKNAVTEAKSQSTCGSCWAFATTGMIESQYAIKYGKLLDFSEQQLIDCDHIDKGCKGGLMTDAYKYLQNHRLEQTKDYGTYKNLQGSCNADESLGLAKVVKYYQIQKDERAIMKELVKHGPIAVGINGRFLQFFDGGVLNPKECDSKINHAVLIVGYGETEQGVPYWTIKNQWGKDWGDHGFFRLIRGEERCGVHTYASIAFLE